MGLAQELSSSQNLKRPALSRSSSSSQKRARTRLGSRNGSFMGDSVGVSSEPISQLFRRIIEFWSIILLRDAVTLRSGPRDLLGEERDRLYLWKSSFTDQDLDGLLENDSDLYRELGVSLRKSLLSIADTLLSSVDIPDSQPKGDASQPDIYIAAQRLKQLVQEGKDALDYPCARVHGISSNGVDGVGGGSQIEEDGLLSLVQCQISRLTKLRFQIKLALSETNGDDV
ncbi:hypothetical protein F5Y15DRAFT_427607 [Xylariaceae sp. FL0016]|nr:hypothetical protein F5Y15DRAFT_427607 [Xylariaceae sp. FL0016]